MRNYIFHFLSPVCLLFVASGCKYNPESNESKAGTWTTASSFGFTPRYGLTSAVINGKIYVIGGRETDSTGDNILSTLEIFDPAANSWSTPATTGTFTSRFWMTSSVVDGKIYVMGGTHDPVLHTLPVNTMEVFDPSTNSWSMPATSGKFTAREGLASAVVGGKIYVIGGNVTGLNGFNTLEVFDPAANTWTTPVTSGTFTPRVFLSACVSNNKIYVIGGDTFGLNGTDTLVGVEVFDPSTNSWSAPVTKGTFTPRTGMTSSVVNGKIYVMGGGDNGGNGTMFNTIDIFDPETNSWSRPVTNGTFTARQFLTSSIVGGKIYVMGGEHLAPQITSVGSNEVFTPDP